MPLTDDVTALDLDDLRQLVGAIEHELATAVRRGQPAGRHVRLLIALEARIARVSDDEPAPATLERQRQRVAAGRGDRLPRRAESSSR